MISHDNLHSIRIEPGKTMNRTVKRRRHEGPRPVRVDNVDGGFPLPHLEPCMHTPWKCLNICLKMVFSGALWHTTFTVESECITNALISGTPSTKSGVDVTSKSTLWQSLCHWCCHWCELLWHLHFSQHCLAFLDIFRFSKISKRVVTGHPSKTLQLFTAQHCCKSARLTGVIQNSRSCMLKTITFTKYAKCHSNRK